MRKLELYTADFETTGIENYNKDGYVRVWLWSLVNVNTKEEYYGFTIGEFFGKILEVGANKIFFHNLRFDGSFIVYWLVENGYVYGTDFEAIIDNMNVWYSIKLKFIQPEVEIWDSLKKFPGQSVQSIAKMYGIEGKKEKPYFDAYRGIDYIPTHEEIEYCLQDSRIIAHAIQREFVNGHTAITLSSDAFKDVKKYIGGYKYWRLRFPVLEPSKEEFARLSYKGGWVYVNPKYQNKELDNVSSYDVNSLYPWVMHDCRLPYGEPVSREPDPDELFIIKVNAEFSLKSNHLPTIQMKKDMRYKSTEYLTESKGETTLSLTSVDWQLFKDHYNIDWIGEPEYQVYKDKVGMLAPYIDYWTDVKIQAKKCGDSATYYLSKRWLNSPYGKTGMRPDRINKIPTWDGEGLTYIPELTTAEPIYVPYASFVCAWARNKTIRSAQSEYKNFVYADTDSIHLIGEQHSGFEIDDTKLGFWKYEGTYAKAKYIRPKTYIHATSDYEPTDIKCAGMPDNIKAVCGWDDFRIGNVWERAKLQQKRVRGGCLLVATDYSIKEENMVFKG